MISRTGTYWSPGITVHWRENATGRNGVPVPAWGASLNFFDDGFTNDDADEGEVSTEGSLRTRYHVRDGDTVSGLSAAVDALIADAARLGIEFRGVPGDSPDLCFETEDELVSGELRGNIAREAARIGWSTPYAPAATTAEEN